jgi:hypothetical protein
MTRAMTPRRFLAIGGLVLIAIGILGGTHLLQRISIASFFNPPYWINWFHLSLGALVLVVALSRASRLQAGITLFAAIVGTSIGLLGLSLGSFAAERFAMPELADPSDHLAHLTVGVVALWGWLNRARAVGSNGNFEHNRPYRSRSDA